MRYLTIYKTAESDTPPSPEHYARMGEFVEEMTKAGVLVTTEGCMPSATGARVRLSNGKVSVTDGPFTESKEQIAGFAILEGNSKEEIIELIKRFLQVAGDGESEIRLIAQAGDCGEELANTAGQGQASLG